LKNRLKEKLLERFKIELNKVFVKYCGKGHNENKHLFRLLKKANILKGKTLEIYEILDTIFSSLASICRVSNEISDMDIEINKVIDHLFIRNGFWELLTLIQFLFHGNPAINNIYLRNSIFQKLGEIDFISLISLETEQPLLCACEVTASNSIQDINTIKAKINKMLKANLVDVGLILYPKERDEIKTSNYNDFILEAPLKYATNVYKFHKIIDEIKSLT